MLTIGLTALLVTELAGDTWPGAIATPLARPIAVLLSLGTVGLLIMHRSTRGRAAIGISTLAAGYAWFVALALIPGRTVPAMAMIASDDRAFGTISLLAANVHSANTNHAAVLDLIDRERPDVLLLMEITSDWIDALDGPLRDLYPTRRVAADNAGNFGIGIWTRMPVDDAQLVVRQHRAQPSLDDVAHAELTLRLNGQRVRVLGIHPLPPITSQMRIARDALLRGIAGEIASEGVPTILLGDLNATRHCRIAREIARTAGLSDATAAVPFSWPTSRLGHAVGIRIDGILATGHWRVVRARAGPPIGSDHLPIMATLKLAIPETK